MIVNYYSTTPVDGRSHVWYNNLIFFLTHLESEYMALSYKKLWKQLIDRDMTRMDLRDAVGLSSTTLAKMSKGDTVTTNVLERICSNLKCNIGDIVDYVPDSDLDNKSSAEQ